MSPSDLVRNLLGDITLDAILWTLVALEFVALLSVPSVLLRRRGYPTAALAWLLALFAMPGLGVLTWWAVGRTRLERKRRRRSQKKRDFRERHGLAETAEGTIFDALLPRRARGDFAFFTHQNQIQLLTDGVSAFREMERTMARAERRIHALMYIFQDDETGRRVAEILAERARAGVQVRLLMDAFGSSNQISKIRKRLAGSGVEVSIFMASRLSPLYSPRLNFTNHRKIITVDDQIAFTGGMNIGEEYEKSWKDLMLRIDGPAAESLNRVFLEDWYYATGKALRDAKPRAAVGLGGECDAAVVSSGPDSEPWIHDAYFLAITRANHRIYLATPYFIPSQAILTALRTAAGRGVDVRILLPSFSDVVLVKWASRSYYRLLVEAGVRIFEYQGAMMHAKALVQDDVLWSVGTANIDSRSFGLSFEVSCFVAHAGLQKHLVAWLDGLFAEALEITPRSLDEKSLIQKLAESAAHLLSPIL